MNRTISFDTVILGPLHHPFKSSYRSSYEEFYRRCNFSQNRFVFKKLSQKCEQKFLMQILTFSTWCAEAKDKVAEVMRTKEEEWPSNLMKTDERQRLEGNEMTIAS